MVGCITCKDKKDIIDIYGIEVWVMCVASDLEATFLSILMRLGKI